MRRPRAQCPRRLRVHVAKPYSGPLFALDIAERSPISLSGTLLHARQNSIFRMDRSSNRNFDPRRQICGPAREAVAGCIYLFRLIVRQAASCAKSELFTLAEEARSPTRTSAPKLPSLTRVKEQGSEPAGGSHLGAWRVGAVRRGTLILQGNPSERNSQCPPMRSFDARARPAVAWPS